MQTQIVVPITLLPCDTAMTNVIIKELTERSSATIEQLVDIWESSVQATHHFVPEKEIQLLKPLVRRGMFNIPLLCVAIDDEYGPHGFMGVEGKKIEMLFISPRQRGYGIGRLFITYALESLEVTLVDVNEQNHQAVGFYRHMGFTVFKRSPTDKRGNPFPILHMEFEKQPSVLDGEKTNQ